MENNREHPQNTINRSILGSGCTVSRCISKGNSVFQRGILTPMLFC